MVGATLRQELKFINAMSIIKLSPKCLLELGKAVMVGMKNTIALSNAIATIFSALQHESAAESTALAFRESSKFHLHKTKPKSFLMLQC